MPRNMSFMLRTEQIKNKTKTVTRRIGWKFLKAGDVVNACVKCQGIKKGQKIQKICQLMIVDVRTEMLWLITQEDVEKEGFHGWTKLQFLNYFCRCMNVNIWNDITRIEFSYIKKIKKLTRVMP